jgi:hypothetical protein
MRTGTAAKGWSPATALLGAGLFLASVTPGAVAAPTAPTAQDLKAALDEANRRVAQQREATGTAPPTPPPAEAGTSPQDLQAALDEVRRRVEEQRKAAPAGDPAVDLRAARERVEALARTTLDLRSERDGLRAQLADAQRRQAAGEEDRRAAETRTAGLEKELAAAKARAGEADGLRAHAGELEAALAKARGDAEAGRAEAERRLAGETEDLKGRLARAERETAELRSVASASVQEVRSLSDQLVAALAERSRLAAAAEELNSSKALQDLQLAAHDDAAPPDAAPRQDPPAAAEAVRRRPKR